MRRLFVRRGGFKRPDYKKALEKFKNQVTDFTALLTARLVSPRLNIPVDEANRLGSSILNKLEKVDEIQDVYAVGNMMASVRFGEQFNIPIEVAKLKRADRTRVDSTMIGIQLRNSESFDIPYGIIAIMGGPDAGKSSIARHIGDTYGVEPIIAMEPIQEPDMPFLIGPSAAALGMVAMLYSGHDFIIYDSGRFLRGISDYGLGEKGLPIGLSLFLTDLNNLYTYCRKRCFLVVSTESNREDYNTAYYELMRGAVNGVIQPSVGSQSGLIEVKPANRIPVTYTYGEAKEFEAVPNLFKIKQEKMLEELNND